MTPEQRRTTKIGLKLITDLWIHHRTSAIQKGIDRETFTAAGRMLEKIEKDSGFLKEVRLEGAAA